MKLLKILAVKLTQALELGTVATSNNRQQCHRQSRWVGSKVVLFARLTIDGQVESKEQKERAVSFIFGQRSLILQTPS